MGHYQPLTWLSFALDLRLGGLDPASAELVPGAFHRTNVALHALTAIAVFFAARRLLGLAADLRPRPRSRARWPRRCLRPAPAARRVRGLGHRAPRRALGAVLRPGLHAWLGFAPRARAPPGGAAAPVTAVVCSAAAAACFFRVGRLDRSEARRERPGRRPRPRPGARAARRRLAAAARVANADRAASRSASTSRRCVSPSRSLAKAWGMVLPALLPGARRLAAGARARAEAGAGWRAPPGSGREGAVLGPRGRLGAPRALGSVPRRSRAARLGEHGLPERALQAAYGLAWYPRKTLVPLEPRADLRAAREPLARRAALRARRGGRRRADGRALGPAPARPWGAGGLDRLRRDPRAGARPRPERPAARRRRYSYLSCLPFALLVGWALARSRRRAPALGLG